MKRCENCGVPLEKRPGVCLEFMAKYTDGPYNCWKPKEECPTCGGTGKVCKHCGKSKPECCIITGHIPCPTCQKPKEERLMMPKKFLSWKKKKDDDTGFWLEDSEGFLYAHIYPGTTGDFAWFLNINKMVEKCHYSTLDKAQQAVEKALEIERG